MRFAYAFATLLSLASTAHAQNIATAVGYPDTTPGSNWRNVCSANPVAIPDAPQLNETSQLSACNAANPNDCLRRVTIPTQIHPDAVCNDGSPGVFYVRPGSGFNRDKWVVHTQGGGMCRSDESCLERWCGQQGALPYKANKMSTDWDGDGVINTHMLATIGGMASANPTNDFHDWTQVWVYYCSSDSWMGRANAVSYGGATPYTLNHQGHNILDATRALLQAGGVGGTVTDDGTPIPDIDAATHVVFTGTSGGAKGAAQNVDWFLAPFTATANTYLVIDGNIDIDDHELAARDIWVDLDGDGIGDDNYVDHRIATINANWASGYQASINAFTDESCRAFYEPIGRLDRCELFSTLFTLSLGGVPVIETPTFYRFDLEDGVVSKPFKDVWPDGVTRLLIGGATGRPTTLEDHVGAARATLMRMFAEQKSVTGLYASRCSAHVGLEATGPYALTTTPDTVLSTSSPRSIKGTDITLHDALVQWLNVDGDARPFQLRFVDTDDVGDPTVQGDPAVKFTTCP